MKVFLYRFFKTIILLLYCNYNDITLKYCNLDLDLYPDSWPPLDRNSLRFKLRFETFSSNANVISLYFIPFNKYRRHPDTNLFKMVLLFCLWNQSKYPVLAFSLSEARSCLPHDTRHWSCDKAGRLTNTNFFQSPHEYQTLFFY